MQYKPDAARLSTLFSPSLAPGAHNSLIPCHCSPSSPLFTSWGSLYWVQVISSSQLSCLPSTLSSPLSSCLVLDTDVIQLVALIPSCEYPTLMCVHWCKPPSIYHSCGCFLLDKKEFHIFYRQIYNHPFQVHYIITASTKIMMEA